MKIIIIFFFTLFTPLINLAGAQPPSTWPPPAQPYAATFTPSLAIIVAVLVAALFFMGFFSIYIRHCGETSAGGTGLRRAISLRNRRLAAARGLDADVIETFPTFTYSEVKDHKIGKGALECAVCLNEFEDDETLRLIPKCDHVFHPECIDAWLESHVTCPVCRANLAPGADVEPVQPPVENGADSVHSVNESVERSDSRSEQVVIEVEGVNETDQVPKMNRIGSLDYTSQPRSWSMRMFGVGKFRSHSTGHSLVQPGENMDRFTLRLPTQLRKDMMNRASLKRVGTIGRYASTLPREQSSKRGFRGEGSNRGGRSYKKVDPQAKSDKWVFFTRGLSMKSLRVGSEADHGSLPETSSSAGTKNSVRKPSFSCLEPKADDEAGLFSEDQLANKSSV